MILSDLKLMFVLFLAIVVETFAEARYIRATRTCTQGCLACSTYNGCFACKTHYYFLLYRSGMKQIGVCTHACPAGYYHNRADDYYRCSRCRIQNCDTCFDKNFCALCETPYLTYQGGCVLSCPPDMYEDVRTAACKPQVDCAVASWTPWGPCTKNSRTCGYKYGTEIRIREILSHPSLGGTPCPELSEERKCRMSVRYCPGQEAKSANKLGKKKTNKTRDKQRIEEPMTSERTSAIRRRRKKKRKLSSADNEVEMDS